MHRVLLTAVTAAFALCANQAQARAYVTGTFMGEPVHQTTTGWVYMGPITVGEDIPIGTSKTFDFSYSLTLHSDGLPADAFYRDPPTGCALIPYSFDCGPTPTGLESTQVDFGEYLFREASGDFNYTLVNYPVEPFTVDAGQTKTYAGTFSIIETRVDYYDLPFSWADVVEPFGIAFVASAPVPEPAESLMFLVGVALMASRLGRRHTGVSGETILL